MDYKHVAISVNDMPEPYHSRKDTAKEWAIKILDDFYRSGDDVWEILLEYHRGQEIRRKSFPIATFRRLLNGTCDEYRHRINVTQRNNRLFIYKTEAADEISL